GIEGAALAWTARTALDLVFFFATARRVLPSSARSVRALVQALALAIPILLICASPASLVLRAVMLLTVNAVAAIFAWQRLLAPEEKAPILDVWAAVRNRRAPNSPRTVLDPRSDAEFTATSLG